MKGFGHGLGLGLDLGLGLGLDGRQTHAHSSLSGLFWKFRARPVKFSWIYLIAAVNMPLCSYKIYQDAKVSY